MDEIHIPSSLGVKHKECLQWFQSHAGAEVGWPLALADGTLLANKAKGIFKPAGLPYAISVKQTVNSPYADREPTFNNDGSWSYLYYQEEQAGRDPEDLSSNRAMRLCMRDRIPVGVLRQLSPKPNVRYRVLGLALIIGKAAGYYLLEGHTDVKQGRGISYSVDENSPLVMQNLDERIFRLRSVVQRQGQATFRERLLEIYERKCAISSCDVPDVLEAAHVLPYRGEHTNHISNGLILRADLHILFDEGLLGIDPRTRAVNLAPLIRSNRHYEQFQGIRLHRGSDVLDSEILYAHYHYCGF